MVLRLMKANGRQPRKAALCSLETRGNVRQASVCWEVGTGLQNGSVLPSLGSNEWVISLVTASMRNQQK